VLELDTIRKDDILVFQLKGKITIGDGDVILRKKIEESLELGFNKIVLNMSRVSYIDSSGTGELVSCYTKVKKQNGQLKLLNISQKIKDILQIAQLMSIFEYYTNEDEAVSSFKK